MNCKINAVLALMVALITRIHSRDVIPGEDDAHLQHNPAEVGFRQVSPSCEQLAEPSVRNYKYNDYLSFSQIEERLKYIACKYSSLAQLSIIGRSVEQRPLYMLTITHDNQMRNDESFVPVEASFKRAVSQLHVRENAAGSKKEENLRNFGAGLQDKPIIFIDAGIHAREWAAPAAALKIIDQLLSDSSKSHLNKLKWKIVPILNPDGYEYSRTRDRMWRKNRAKFPGSACVGVDLNRNMDIHWSETVRRKCSIQYGGPTPFSEPETRALRDALNKDRKMVKGYITFHSYGKLILYPFGYTTSQKPRTVTKLKAMGNAMSQAIKRKFGSGYQVEQASFLGAAAGGTDDWAYLSAGVPFSYTFELQPSFKRRNTLRFSGFELPKSQLLRAVEEAWVAAETMANKIATNPHLRSSSSLTPDAVTIQDPPTSGKETPGIIEKLRGGQRKDPKDGDILKDKDEPSMDECYYREGNVLICPQMLS